MSVAPTLVLAWGNRSRGDDALGPLLAEALRETADPAQVEVIDDYQLQPEHALDLQQRRRVLFVDASRSAAPPFALTQPEPLRDASFSSHAMSPQALLWAYTQVVGGPPPPSWLLAIRGERFELGEPAGEAARGHLEAALTWARHWLRPPGVSRRVSRRADGPSRCGP